MPAWSPRWCRAAGPGRTGSASGFRRSASRNGRTSSEPWPKTLGTQQNCCPAKCPKTSRTSSPAWACRYSPAPPESYHWTAPAPTTRSHASTWPPPSTCWPESFDEDPFAILAWRGREREDLLANLAAARADGAAPAADHAEQVAQPLTDCLDRYYARQADINVPSPPATPSTALLDQLPDTGLSARGRPLTELLRPAYHALTHHHNSAGG